jgi:hypothetical protein
VVLNGIVIYPANPNYYFNPKMLVMGYRGGVSNQPRSFIGWGTAKEISWNNGATMNTCQPTIGYLGKFTMTVSQ